MLLLSVEPTVRVMHFGSFKDSKFFVFQAVKLAGQERQSIHVLFPEQQSVLLLISVI